MDHTSIEDVMDNVLKFMEKKDPYSDEFSSAARALKELSEAREKFTKGDQNLKEIKNEEPKSKISPQLLSILAIAVPAVTGILQIGLILWHEELNVVTTKALGFVVKGRFS